jgi:murein DD-endopeptidase MepM/ murein hydrolase activator NlpD
MVGVIENVSYSRFAYGNAVIINHGNGITSLYAHLSIVEAEEGQEVTMDTKLGEMGATGRSFGDHLHLEVRDHGRAINPLSVLPLKSQ